MERILESLVYNKKKDWFYYLTKKEEDIYIFILN